MADATPRRPGTAARRRPAPRGAVAAVCLAAGLCAGPGCRTAYWRDRGRDLADTVTATTGPGLGLSVRAGPVQAAPLVLYMDTAGLRGGECFHVPGLGLGRRHPPQDVGALWWCCSVWVLPERPRLEARAKAHLATPLGLGPGAQLYDLHTDTPPFLAVPRRRWNAEQLEVARYPAAYHGALEATVALGWGLRLGVNAAEIADFALGWCGVDLLADDLGPGRPLWRPPWLGTPPAEAAGPP